MAELALKDTELRMIREEYEFDKRDIAIDYLIDRFLEYNRTNHRWSTTRRYKSIMDHLRRYLAEKRPDVIMLSKLTPEVVEGYKTFRRDEWVNPNGKPVNGDAPKEYSRQGARARTVSGRNRPQHARGTELNVGFLRRKPCFTRRSTRL